MALGAMAEHEHLNVKIVPIGRTEHQMAMAA